MNASGKHSKNLDYSNRVRAILYHALYRISYSSQRIVRFSGLSSLTGIPTSSLAAYFAGKALPSVPELFKIMDAAGLCVTGRDDIFVRALSEDVGILRAGLPFERLAALGELVNDSEVTLF